MKTWFIDMDLLQKFQQHWADRRFVNADQTVLLAVSGGIDSMVMADLFLKIKAPFAIAHCNFQLRGEDAMQDELFVAEWALKNHIPFHYTRFETKKQSEEWKKGIQETARILRYEWLDGIREENKYAAIATAHHANDNVETLLINLFKGTGMAGLHAIPEQNGNIIRPLLFAQKGEIKAYADANRIAFWEDVSNETDAYLRNAVRHHIIPAAEKWFPNAIQHVNESIFRFTQAEILYKKAIEQERKKLLEKRGQDYYIPVLKLKNRVPLETICYELFARFGFTSAQIPHIINLFSSESGHFVSSDTHRIIKNRNFLIVTAAQTQATDFITIEGFPCTVETEDGHFHFSVDKKPKALPSAQHIACIDMKRISFPIILRRWKQGDYFYPLGMGMKKKKLSKFFIDQKVPLHEKEKIWVLECQKRIAWVAGMRLDERFKVTDQTEQIVKIDFSKP